MGADYWYPYNGVPNSPMPGFMIELAERALAQHDMSLQYVVVPWPRAIYMARENKLDCVIGAHKEEAPDFIFGEEAYGVDKAHFYVRSSSSWVFEGITSLENQRIGVIIGYNYGKPLDDWLSANATFLGGTDALTKNIKKLVHGRLDAVIESKAVMDAKLHELGLSQQVKISGSAAAINNTYIACGPNNEKSTTITKALDNGIQLLRKKGEVQKIMKKYGLSDWKTKNQP